MDLKRVLWTITAFCIVSAIVFAFLINISIKENQISAQIVAVISTPQPSPTLTFTPVYTPQESQPFLTPNFNELSDFFSKLPYRDSISIFYHNLYSGFIFGFRDDLEYTSASLNKASHAFYIYYLAENGMADLERQHVLRASDLRGGTGVIQFMPLGTVFTERQLLAHSIIDSDNIAFRILVEAYANHEFSYHDFIESLGGNTELVRNITGRWFSAAEAGFVMEQIHNYLESGGLYSEEFRYNLMVADAILYPIHPAAQKYGHWREAFHTMSLVYSPSPFILTILTNLGEYRYNFEIIEEIYSFIQYFNTKYFE